MDLVSLTVTVLLAALLVQLSHFWARVAFVVALGTGAVLVGSAVRASTNSIDILSVTLALDPPARDFLILGLGLTGLLALAGTYETERTELGFLFGSWVGWTIALVVNNFVVAVFAWAFGLVAPVLAMQPRRYRRASGAAYYMVLVVVAGASLIVANRFIEVFPLTPERTWMIQLAVLFLCWGFGLLLAIPPLSIWVAPMADDAHLSSAASVIALGQPVGLWLLYRLLIEYPWLMERSDLLTIIGLGGTAAVAVGGLLALVEQRGGRLLGYVGLFSMGIVMLELSHAQTEWIANAGVEVAFRALCLCVMASLLIIGRNVNSRVVRYMAAGGFLLTASSFAGLRIGIGLFERWPLWLELAGGDQRLLALVVLAQIAVLVGLIRFAAQWLEGLPESSTSVVGAAASSLPKTRPEPKPALAEPAEAAVVKDSPSELRAVNGGVGSGSWPVQVIAQAETQIELARPATAASASEDSEDGKRNGVESEEPEIESSDEPDTYVFEDHVREIAAAMERRVRPLLGTALRSLPSGTAGLVLITFRTWRTWTSFILVIGLFTLIIAVGLTPSIWSERSLAELGAVPFAR